VLGDGPAVLSNPVLTGDVNGDGRTDLIFYWYDPAKGLTTRTSLANPDGTFAPTTQRVLGDGPSGNPVLTGDVNGDGRTDLIFYWYDPAKGLTTRTSLANPDGTFAPTTQRVLGDGPGVLSNPILVGDVNGDGRADLVFTFGGTNFDGFHVRTDQASASTPGSFLPTTETVLAAAPVLAISGLPQWSAGQHRSGTIAVSGGSGGYRNLAVTGLPSWLTASLSGGQVVLDGTPTQSGTYGNIKVSVQDSRGATVCETFSFSANLGLGPAALPGVSAGQSYSATITAVGGSGKYTYALPTSSTLPRGLSLSPSGVLSGTPTVAGTYSFLVQARDASSPGLTGTQTFTLTVTPGAATGFTLSSPSTAAAGSPFIVTVTARDAYGNVATGYGGTASISSSDGIVQNQQVVVTGGTGSATLSLTVAHPVTLGATAGSLSGSIGLIVVPGAVTSLTVGAPSSVTAGSLFTVSVTATDRYGNGFVGTAHVRSSVGGSSWSVPVSGGTGSATGVLTTAAATTLTVTAGSASKAVTVVVNPGALSRFGVSATSSTSVGSSVSVSATAYDAYGNTVTAYNGTARLNSSNGQVVPPTTLSFHNGIAAVTVTATHSGSTTLTVTSGAASSNGAGVSVAATEFYWTLQCEVEYRYTDYDGYTQESYFYTEYYTYVAPNLLTASGWATAHAGQEYSNYDWYNIFVSYYSYQPAN
jgi:hypothetical protein